MESVTLSLVIADCLGTSEKSRIHIVTITFLFMQLTLLTYRNFLQTLHILDLINHGDQEIQARVENPREFSHSFNDPCFLKYD